MESIQILKHNASGLMIAVPKTLGYRLSYDTESRAAILSDEMLRPYCAEIPGRNTDATSAANDLHRNPVGACVIGGALGDLAAYNIAFGKVYAIRYSTLQNDPRDKNNPPNTPMRETPIARTYYVSAELVKVAGATVPVLSQHTYKDLLENLPALDNNQNASETPTQPALYFIAQQLAKDARAKNATPRSVEMHATHDRAADTPQPVRTKKNRRTGDDDSTSV